MVSHGVLVPRTCTIGIVSPMGSVVKNSDIMRAKVLAGITVKDQASLTAATLQLTSMGQPKIKSRITTDVSATGINNAAYSPPFMYPSLQDGLRLIRRGGYLGKADIGRYFHSFPLAYEARKYFNVEFELQGCRQWTYVRCPFGFSPCPMYASTWSAEIKLWFASNGIETAHLMDDWLVAADGESEVKAKLDKLSQILISCGFYMSVEKNEHGKRMTFLGVELNTETMRLSFDRTQSKGMRIQLESYLEKIVSRNHLDPGVIRHVCGKLNWYSEVVQSGRIHIASWWNYQRHHYRLSDIGLKQLVVDTMWWINLLHTWELNNSSRLEYSILSAEELISRNDSITVLQSDASGPHGFGYHFSYYGDDAGSAKWVSKRWPINHQYNVSSHSDELMALKDFLLSTHVTADSILVWVTDSESAMWSVNKGRCHSAASLSVLSDILTSCDSHRIQLVALWVPREQNTAADYLSHLSYYMNREEVSGQWADSAGASPGGGQNRNDCQKKESSQHFPEVSQLV